jgi:hypothetical protein
VRIENALVNMGTIAIQFLTRIASLNSDGRPGYSGYITASLVRYSAMMSLLHKGHRCIINVLQTHYSLCGGTDTRIQLQLGDQELATARNA